MTSVLGVDVGGTFTDFLLWDDGTLRIHKRPSTPDDPARAVLEGLAALDATPSLVVHGSTIATNAVLERRGARTALVTTEGMRDLLRIGRQARSALYALEPEAPAPLVDPELAFELHARLRPDGSVELAPDHSEVRNLVREAEEGGAEALAVSLLYAYANPAIEELFDQVASPTGLYLALSSRVSPEYREVERTTTTVLNAYVGPVMAGYLDRLAGGLAARGVPALRIVQSDGGTADAARAAALPVATLLSGPAAGAAGAFAIARDAGFPRAITFDMGGTSTDVALCDGVLPTTPELAIGDFTARTPAVDVHTVGAGGGSIARLDTGGALRVGPHSAGADPGPACYGRGHDCTVTDAQLVLGRLPARALLGGTMRLDERRARTALAPFLSRFGGDPHRAAQAVLDVVTANMERALRVVSVHRGYDPREFTLVASGGAGPLLACALADALDLPRVLVPRYPGVLAALGAAAGDVTATHARSVLRPLDAASLPALRAALDAARDAAALALADAPQPPALECALDLRYAGQSFELTVPLEAMHGSTPARSSAARSDSPSPPTGERGPGGEGAPLFDFDRARRDFDALHETRFGHHDPTAPVEVVTARATARLPGVAVALLAALRTTPPSDARRAPQPATVDVWIANASGTGGTRVPAALHARDALREGDRLAGPTIVTQLDTTTYIAPGWLARVDAAANLVLERA